MIDLKRLRHLTVLVQHGNFHRAAEESLVPSSTADRIIETAIGPVLRALEGMESALKVKCNPSDPELAGSALREWANRTRTQCSQALSRLANRLS